MQLEKVMQVMMAHLSLFGALRADVHDNVWPLEDELPTMPMVQHNMKLPFVPDVTCAPIPCQHVAERQEKEKERKDVKKEKVGKTEEEDEIKEDTKKQEQETEKKLQAEIADTCKDSNGNGHPCSKCLHGAGRAVSP